MIEIKPSVKDHELWSKGLSESVRVFLVAGSAALLDGIQVGASFG